MERPEPIPYYTALTFGWVIPRIRMTFTFDGGPAYQVPEWGVGHKLFIGERPPVLLIDGEYYSVPLKENGPEVKQ